MSLKSRLCKLEAAKNIESEAINISVFFVVPDIEPIGYVCGSIQIMRMPGESVDELQTRCTTAVTWPDGNSILLFDPLDA